MRLYHKTDIKNIQSILKDGLQCKYASYIPRIYLCKYPNMDMGLGKALFEVNIPDDDPKLNQKDGEGYWEFISWEDLPVKWMTYLGEYGPNEKPEINE